MCPMVRILGIVLTTVAFVSLVHADPIVVKFSHVTAPDSPKGKAALRFKEAAERRTNNRVKIEVYAKSALFADKEEMDALIAGKVEMLAPSLAKFEDAGVKEFEVFSAPYIFPGKDMLRRVTDGPLGQEILKKLDPKGIVGLAYWDNGFKSWAANKPIRKPGDVSGLKMRVSSPVNEPLIRALGGIPVALGFSKVYEALKTGQVDGNDNVPSNLYTTKFYEVQKHITVSDHQYLGYAVIANKKFWDGLPNDVRVQLKLAVTDATRDANLYAERDNHEALEKIKASGKSEIYTLSIDERTIWRQALLPVHKEFESRVGKELMQAVYKEGMALGYKF